MKIETIICNVVLILFLGSVTSCHYNTELDNAQFTFEREIHLEGEEILGTEGFIWSLEVVDTLLVGWTRMSDYQYVICNLKDYTKIAEIGRLGEGPDEFDGSTYFSGQYDNINDSLYLWFFQPHRNGVFRVNLSQVLNKEKLAFDRKFKVRPHANLTLDVFYLNDSTIIGPQTNTAIDMKRFITYNPANHDITVMVDNFPKVENRNNDIDFIQFKYNHVYLNRFDVDEAKGKAVQAMRYFNRIDVFDFEGNNDLSIVEGPENPICDLDHFINNQNLYLCYQDLCLIENGIFASFCDDKTATEDEIRKGQIRVFDWKGNPKFLIHTPYNLDTFTIDENNGWLIGCCIEEDKKLRFNISSVLKELNS